MNGIHGKFEGLSIGEAYSDKVYQPVNIDLIINIIGDGGGIKKGSVNVLYSGNDDDIYFRNIGYIRNEGAFIVVRPFNHVAVSMDDFKKFLELFKQNIPQNNSVDLATAIKNELRGIKNYDFEVHFDRNFTNSPPHFLTKQSLDVIKAVDNAIADSDNIKGMWKSTIFAYNEDIDFMICVVKYDERISKWMVSFRSWTSKYADIPWDDFKPILSVL